MIAAEDGFLAFMHLAINKPNGELLLETHCQSWEGIKMYIPKYGSSEKEKGKVKDVNRYVTSAGSYYISDCGYKNI